MTPTGAAIAAALRTGGQLPAEFKILRTGLGAGKRDYRTAGVLRAMLLEAGSTNHDRILVMETNMDDCTGEAMGFVMEELLEAGALDVFYTPHLYEKTPARLSALRNLRSGKKADHGRTDFPAYHQYRLRFREMQRTKLSRKIISLETPWAWRM